MDRYRWQIQALNRAFPDSWVEWDLLNRDLLAGHPMMDSRYLEPLVRHCGDGTEHLCRCEINGDLAGMAILKPALPGIWQNFIPVVTPGFPLNPMILADLSALTRLPSALPGWVGQLDLQCHDPRLASFSQDRAPAHRRQRHVLTMAIRLEGDFDAYWKQRSGNLRSALRQRHNRLAKAGLEPRLVRLAEPGQMAGAVQRYAALELSGWKSQAGTAVSPDNVKGLFYREMLEKFAETGQAAVYEYWVGERQAASQIVIFNDRMLTWLKTTYNESLANFSPGLLLLHEVVRDSFSRLPGAVFEFYTNTGGSPLQLAWSTEQRWLEHVTVFRSDTVREIASAIRAVKGVATPLRALARRLRPTGHPGFPNPDQPPPSGVS